MYTGGVEDAAEAGAGGVACVRGREGWGIDTSGAVKDNLSDEQKQELLSRTGAEPGTLLLFGAGDTATVNKALDRVRQYLAKELGMVKAERDNDQWNFLWVVDFPMFEFNSDENRYEALHHPFCTPAELAHLLGQQASWQVAAQLGKLLGHSSRVVGYYARLAEARSVAARTIRRAAGSTGRRCASRRAAQACSQSSQSASQSPPRRGHGTASRSPPPPDQRAGTS